jgi:branched-chain amino acid transport system substrate-binding protein
VRVLVALALCLVASPAAGDKQPEPAPKLVVGAFLTLTGAEASFGVSTLQGIELAVAERNARGGINKRPIELVTLDTAGKAAEAGPAVTRLVQEHRAIAVLGDVMSSISIAGARTAQQLGVPMITPSSTHARVTSGGDLISRVCMIDAAQGAVMATHARELGVKSVAVLVDANAAVSKELAKELGDAFVALGGKIATEQSYESTATSFTTQLEAVKTARADAIVIPGYYTQVAAIAKEARAMKLKTRLLGFDGWDSEELAKLAGPAIEGGRYVNHYVPGAPGAANAAFVRAYKKKYKVAPDTLAALGYDAARVLFDAIARAPSTSGKDLGAAIRATRKFAGVTGTITIGGDGNPVKKPGVIVEMKRGKPVFAASVTPK